MDNRVGGQDGGVLLIGPLINDRRDNLGGATISFEYLTKFFDEQIISYSVINTQAYQGFFGVLSNLLSVCWQAFFQMCAHQFIFLNVSQKGIRFLAPPLILLARLRGRKIVVRPFGGSYASIYKGMSRPERFIAQQTVLKVDLLFLQTRQLCNFFKPLCRRVAQLPTSRYRAEKPAETPVRSFDKRFVFMGHIKQSKGIDIIINALEYLDHSYTIHLYGTIIEPVYADLIDRPDLYRGQLANERVREVLATYDVLLLPTFYGGEGYPGIIVESYSIGKPVIATDWNAISEIVRDGVTGLLIQPQKVEHLVEAIKSINDENYDQYRRGASTFF